MSSKGQTVEQVATLCNITPRRVQQLATEGVFQKVGRGRYNAVQCVHAYIRYWQDRALSRAPEPEAGTLEDARRRKTEAEASLAEMELAREQGRMISVDDLEEMLSGPLYRLRAKLLNLPTKWAPALVGCRTIAEAQARLESSVEEAMRSLADDDDDEHSDDDTDRAA